MQQSIWRKRHTAIGAIIGALWGGLFPPVRMMLTEIGAIIFIIGGSLFGALIANLPRLGCKLYSFLKKQIFS